MNRRSQHDSAGRGEQRFPRSARINEVLHEVLADELERMSDPRLDLVTVTGVEVSPDLKHARVFYSCAPVLGDMSGETDVTGDPEQEEAQATAKALESARRHLQAALGRQVRLKYVPRLLFEEDQAVKTGRRIDEIIRGLHLADENGDTGAPSP